MIAKRARLGLSQDALADLAGVNRAYVGQLETASRNPSLLILARIAEALEADIVSLLRSTRSRPPKRYSTKGRKPTLH